MKANLLYLHTLAPLHVGVGQSGDVVDLPVAREKATAWPVVPGSGFKGALRSLAGNDADSLFGRIESSGAVAVTDLRLLLLPVRSFYGAVAWVTCPLALGRWARDAAALGLDVGFEKQGLAVADAAVLVAPESAVSGTLDGARKLVLEDLDLAAEDDPAVAQLGQTVGAAVGVGHLAQHLAVVSDTLFSFLAESALEVSAHVRLEDDRKTVARGALWYEEAVPAEAVFYGFAVVLRDEEQAADGFRQLVQANPTIFVGGNTTTGMGLCRVRVSS